MDIDLAFSLLKKWNSIGRIQSILSFFILISMADGKPTRLLPRHALEKYYHSMLREGGSVETNIEQKKLPKGTATNELQFNKFYKRQYSTISTQPLGMTTRVLIYSVASKGFISVDGTHVDGKGSRYSESAIISMESIGFGKVRLRGELSNNYICFKDTGKLIGQQSGDVERCVFRTSALPNDYTAFKSCAKKSYWIGIRQKGTAKRGTRTKLGQRATQFIVVKL